MIQLTDEQLRVIHHPFGQHARVLAVAGAGKTTTMAHRVKYMVEAHGINPHSILILMFNRLARLQFSQKLAQIIPDRAMRPKVNTFHSFSYGLLLKMMDTGFLPKQINFWGFDEGDYQAMMCAHKAIQAYSTKSDLDPESVDVEQLLEAISLWKGALIPPPRAGYAGNAPFEALYHEYERIRIRENALTFDDFVPMVVGALEAEPALHDDWCNRYQYIIADEYQDVNYGQQRLIELLANRRADVMVVGDDDQTIYEWRGARPNYITKQFQRVFNDRPHQDYTLSHSFRFGALLAQCAYNSVQHNVGRYAKPVIAHNPAQAVEIEIFSSDEETTNLMLLQQIVHLRDELGDARRLVVLGRMYAQLSGLESACLLKRVPYEVAGRAPFFDRHENRVLRDYLQIGLTLHAGITRDTITRMLAILNVPNRMLRRATMESALEEAQIQQLTLYGGLVMAAKGYRGAMGHRYADFVRLLDDIHGAVKGDEDLAAGHVLAWISQELDFADHFDRFYGDGEASEERKRSVEALCNYALITGLAAAEFLAHLNALDTTQGVRADPRLSEAEKEQRIVKMMTVHRTKGLEYDYVFIPECIEGFMPFPAGGFSQTYDREGLVDRAEAIDEISSERRLFYVAITRAKQAVYLGSVRPTPEDRRVPSRFLHEMLLANSRHLLTTLALYGQDPCPAHANGLKEAIIDSLPHDYLLRPLATHYLPQLGYAEAGLGLGKWLDGVQHELARRQKRGIYDQTLIDRNEPLQTQPLWSQLSKILG